MLQQAAHSQSEPQRRLSMALADSTEAIREAQRLRYRVFAEEMGAHLPAREPGVDADIYDPFCDHLLVKDDHANEVVGTYRLLPPHQAKRIGSYYAESEFDLTRLATIRSRMVEVGRSCVHPDYRNGGAITMLWAGLAQYMVTHRYDYLAGCASISMADGGHMAASIYRQIRDKHLSPAEWRVFPRCRLPLEVLDSGVACELPPLIKGYLRLGAYICGEPAWDPDFNTADLLILLPMARLNPRYLKHFVG